MSVFELLLDLVVTFDLVRDFMLCKKNWGVPLSSNCILYVSCVSLKAFKEGLRNSL